MSRDLISASWRDGLARSSGRPTSRGRASPCCRPVDGQTGCLRRKSEAVAFFGVPRSRSWALLAAGLFLVAFAVRLVPLLVGGGPWGLGDYDDGVHYAAAAALLHGHLPYRDYLFLNPPGIVLAAVPVVGMSQLLGEPDAFAAGRLLWMGLGSLTCVLVARFVLPLGLAAAAIAGLAYATFPPAVIVDHLLLQEGLQNLLFAAALLAIALAADGRARWLLVAGGLLGVATMVKIWAITAVLVVAVFLGMTVGWRRAGIFACGVAAGGVMVGLPFFLAAQGLMWEMVVIDQVRRVWFGTIWQRLATITGVSLWSPGSGFTAVVAVAVVALGVLLCAAFTVRRLRLVAALLVVFAVVVLVTPSPHMHYGALVAVPAAIVVGGGAWRLADARWSRVTPALVAASLLVAGLFVRAVPALSYKPEFKYAPGMYGIKFPSATLRTAALMGKCVTSNDPTTLVLLNVLNRNLSRGCPFVVDVSGAAYHGELWTGESRFANEAWQRYALGVFRSGDLMIMNPYAPSGYTNTTLKIIRSWPTVKKAGVWHLRTPRPPDAGGY
jgi:alpha-1,2-mannosyltransferase